MEDQELLRIQISLLMEQDGAVQHLDPSPLCFLPQGAL